MFQRTATPVRLTGVGPAETFFAPAVRADAKALHVAHVDERARCIHLAAYPREGAEERSPIPAILRDAAELGSVGLVLAHSQDEPLSARDTEGWTNTRQLAAAADLIQVTLLDHLVFHGRDCTSLRRLGVI